MNYLTTSALMVPAHFSIPAPWAGHIPFAAWLISIQQPKCLVELGTYSGISYMAFCQAIKEHGLLTEAYAVDTWQGDPHAGTYGESVYQALKEVHDSCYGVFSTLMRMTFDEARSKFADSSIDLLHIDGFHTYEAVRHDFESWLPKLSECGVVLFHDTNVYRDGFGVYRLWAEVERQYPSIQFKHSHGLGVLLVGTKQPKELLELCQPAQAAKTREIFAALGERLETKAQILTFQHQLKDALEREHEQLLAGEKRHQWILQQDETIRTQEIRLQQQDEVIRTQEIRLQQQDEDIRTQEIRRQQQDEVIHTQEIRRQQQDEAIRAQEIRLQQQEQIIRTHVLELDHLGKQLANSQKLIEEIYGSRSWRITAGLRLIGRMMRQKMPLLRRLRNGMRYITKGEWKALIGRFTTLRREAVIEQRFNQVHTSIRPIGIMTTPHTLFVAHLMVQALQKAGFNVEVFTEAPETFELGTYFVLCPQMFKRLPPGEKRIAFQMEQSVSSRWFTPEYFKLLENSLAVFDYAQTNLRFMEKYGIVYPHTYFVPIGGFEDYAAFLQSNGLVAEGQDEPCEVLFYGDVNAPRRQKLLTALQQHFNTRVVGNLFGPELHRALISAQVLVNIHYYEGALLETTRIYESLSLGVAVVSEISADISEHQVLEDVVHFVPIGDAQALVQTVSQVLKQKEATQDSVSNSAVTQSKVKQTAQYFNFMFYRALYALRMLTHQQWNQLTADFPLPNQKLALSLPETTERRATYLAVQPEDVTVFEGIRYRPSWIGCALSYQYLAKKALAAGVPWLEVMEDDVMFLDTYPERRAIVDAWLSEHAGKWDIFAGLIAEVHKDTRIIDVEKYNGLMFVTLSRMTSMVHNIYAKNILEIITKWDPDNADAQTNTIDRYLQSNSSLRVILVLPFLIGHRENVNSSLWGINNRQYTDSIKQAEQTLFKMSEDFEIQIHSSN